MLIYDFDEIKKAGDCREILRNVLHVPETGKEGRDGWQRFAYPPWRPDSDSGGFAASREAWKDHAKNEGGDVIELVKRGKFNGDMWAAQNFLGEYYHIKAKTKPKEKCRRVAEYVYTDELGIPVHRTVRFEPKAFHQEHLTEDGEWKPGLKGIHTYLYNLTKWFGSDWVCVVEGEKDADTLASVNIPATTNPMGAENWKAEYNEYFRGKKVVILPDNDEKGERHAAVVSWNLKNIAKEIRIIRLPHLPAKGDVSDWLASFGTPEKLFILINETPALEQDKIEEPKREASPAKIANANAFSNYREEWQDQPTGGQKLVKSAIHINDLVAEIFRRFHDFPRRVGDTLFDHDRKMKQIRFITKPAELFSWIQEKSGHELKWGKIEGAVTQDQLFCAVFANAKRYEAISGVPNWPARSDVYYTHGKLPDPNPDAAAFNKFCSFFSPATELDAFLIRAFFMSPIYFKPKIDRPLWIIDATTGQGSGKTKLAEMAAYLYGGDDIEQGEPIWVDAKQIVSEQMIEPVKRRLLSCSGRKKRIFLIDNVMGYFGSSALASMVTQGSLSGIAPYGRGEETRPNDLTFVITSNSATVNKDLSGRGFIINVKRPEKPSREWEKSIQEFISKNRLEVIADIIGILERGAPFDFEPQTRFRSWEREILAPACGELETYQQVIQLNMDRQDNADGEKEESEEIRAYFKAKIKDCGFDPDKDTLFIRNPVLKTWAREASVDFGGHTNRAAISILHNWSKTKMIPELSNRITRFPHGSGGQRGLIWNCPDELSRGMKIPIIEPQKEA